jgi:hypothetical protein
MNQLNNNSTHPSEQKVFTLTTFSTLESDEQKISFKLFKMDLTLARKATLFLQQLLAKIHNWIEGHCQSFYTRVASLCVGHPWFVLLACLIFTAICGIGFIRIDFSEPTLDVWIPKNAPSK